MKAIYTIVDNKVLRVAQDTAIPADNTFQAPGVSTTASVDAYQHTATEHIYINTFKKPGTKSNKEMYKELVNYLKTNKITEIPDIQNFFYLYIDYAIYQDNKEVSHNAVIRPIEPVDKMIPLGVATNNECVFRRCKTFNPTVELKVTNTLPFGITQRSQNKFRIKVHNIAIFEDTMIPHVNYKSWNDCPVAIGSASINNSLSSSIMIYSTENAGFDIQPFNVNFTPNTVFFALDIVLADYVVVYDKRYIDDILIENINEKYNHPDSDPVVPDDDPTDPESEIQDDDIIPDADGDYDPDDNGYFDFYERCTEYNPNKLLVVEDLIRDGDYDVHTMVRKGKVIRDIPDIQIGEYVLYRESFVVDRI